jgi:gluconate 2-dehydrogenase gamma chain
MLERAGRAGVAGVVVIGLPPQLPGPPRTPVGNLPIPGTAPATGTVFAPSEQETLRAAVARIIPAEGPGDWSAADAGADEYIAGLLAGVSHIYAGGPVRADFPSFQTLSRVKQIVRSAEVRRLRQVYSDGLAQLNALAGGDFAVAPPAVQDAILTELDDSGSDFFTALFNHTMEGVYAHPVYGGNRNYQAWQAFGYAGDVHGVRFPHIGPADAPWNVYGGYAPQEMAEPGKEST